MKRVIKKLLREGLNDKLTYNLEHLDSYQGQDNYELGLYLNDDILGLTQYTLYDGEISISDILVRPEFRRKGLGSRMIQYIKQKHPEHTYVPSMKTDLGAKFKHKDMSGKLDTLNEGIYEDNLERLFHGQTKVRTRIVFAKPNPHGTTYNDEFEQLAHRYEDRIENVSQSDKERVNLEDIAPTQRFVSLKNLKEVEGIGRDTDAVLLLLNGVYYAIDGHHRIVNRILHGDSYIIAHVIRVN